MDIVILYVNSPVPLITSPRNLRFGDRRIFRRFCPLSPILPTFADRRKFRRFCTFLTKKIFGLILSLYFPILTTFLLRNNAILFNVFLLFA